MLEFLKRGHHAFPSLPVVLFHYFDPKAGCTIAELLHNDLLERFSGSNNGVLKYVLVIILRLDHFFTIGHQLYLRCFFLFFFGSIVIQANTSDNLTNSLSVRSFLPTFAEVGRWWVEEIGQVGLLAFFRRL